MDISAKQLHDLRAAYAVGRLKPMVDVTDKEIELELDQAQLAVSPPTPAEQELLGRCSRYRVAALKACREGKYAIAEYLFADIENLLQKDTFSPMGRLIAQSAHEAAVAYLDYRRGRFEIGTGHIYRALACDETLEEAYGLTIYHIHRLRLLLNLVRLQRRQGAEEEALRLGIMLMDYLEQKVASLPFPTTWDSQRLDHLPLAAKNFLFEQAMYEILFLIVGQEKHLASWPALLSQHTSATVSPACQLSPRAHLWLRAKQELQAQHPDCFCELVLPLIAAGPGGSLWLWYGTVMDVFLLCRDLSSEPAELLLEAIAADLPSWNWSKFPPFWKQIVETTSLRVRV